MTPLSPQHARGRSVPGGTAGNPGASLLELPGWLRLAGSFAGNSPLFGGVTCAEAGQPARIEHKAATNSARGLSHPLSAEPASKAGAFGGRMT